MTAAFASTSLSILALWKSGLNTADIATRLRMKEAEVANMLGDLLDRSRAAR